MVDELDAHEDSNNPQCWLRYRLNLIVVEAFRLGPEVLEVAPARSASQSLLCSMFYIQS